MKCRYLLPLLPVLFSLPNACGSTPDSDPRLDAAVDGTASDSSTEDGSSNDSSESLSDGNMNSDANNGSDGSSVDGGDGGALSSTLVPASGVLWGAFTKFVQGKTGPEALADFETAVGRKFQIAHFYHQWNDAFPTTPEIQSANGGRLLFLNWKPTNSWTQIAAGAEDTAIDAAAVRAKNFGQKFFLTFHHEPEDQVGTSFGTAADYASAYRRIHDRFVAAGATNVVWVWNVMGFSGWYSIYPALYPGDSYVDWIAWDPYNWAKCRNETWKTFSEIVDSFYTYLDTNHPTKPRMLGEYGSDDNTVATPTKADWFATVVPGLKSHPKIKAAVFFHSNPTCNWLLEDVAEVSGFSNAGKDPYVNP